MSMIFLGLWGRRRFFFLNHLWTVDDFFVWIKSTILTFTNSVLVRSQVFCGLTISRIGIKRIFDNWVACALGIIRFTICYLFSLRKIKRIFDNWVACALGIIRFTICYLFSLRNFDCAKPCIQPKLLIELDSPKENNI